MSVLCLVGDKEDNWCQVIWDMHCTTVHLFNRALSEQQRANQLSCLNSHTPQHLVQHRTCADCAVNAPCPPSLSYCVHFVQQQLSNSGRSTSAQTTVGLETDLTTRRSVAVANPPTLHRPHHLLSSDLYQDGDALQLLTLSEAQF